MEKLTLLSDSECSKPQDLAINNNRRAINQLIDEVKELKGVTHINNPGTPIALADIINAAIENVENGKLEPTEHFEHGQDAGQRRRNEQRKKVGVEPAEEEAKIYEGWVCDSVVVVGLCDRRTRETCICKDERHCRKTKFTEVKDG